MSSVLAVVEEKEGRIRATGREGVTVAASLAEALGGEAHALVIGGAGSGAGAGTLGQFGARSVRAAEHDAFATYRPQAFGQVVADVVRNGDFGAVVFAASAMGRDLAPRVAALLDVPLAQDVTEVTVEGDAVVATRPVYAGKAFQRARMDAKPALLSLRPNSVTPTAGGADVAVETFQPDVQPGSLRSTVVGFEAAGSGALDVGEATVVVSGGRGMGGAEHWGLLEGLAQALGPEAGLGASRAVVDAGWRPHGEQVGQTGKTVAPKLYIAVGISGAIQHLAGMKTSGTIVAINKDPEAPIFQVADYGIVGDLFEVVPALTQAVAAMQD